MRIDVDPAQIDAHIDLRLALLCDRFFKAFSHGSDCFGAVILMVCFIYCSIRARDANRTAGMRKRKHQISLLYLS